VKLKLEWCTTHCTSTSGGFRGSRGPCPDPKRPEVALCPVEL